MKKLKYRLQPRSQLTLENIKSCGWTEKIAYKEEIFFIPSYKTIFEKGNYALACYVHETKGAIIEIMVRDPCKITWMTNPEQFRITMPCPNLEIFKIITGTLEEN